MSFSSEVLNNKIVHLQQQIHSMESRLDDQSKLIECLQQQVAGPSSCNPIQEIKPILAFKTGLAGHLKTHEYEINKENKHE